LKKKPSKAKGRTGVPHATKHSSRHLSRKSNWIAISD
jgi:hypothetical protein